MSATRTRTGRLLAAASAAVAVSAMALPAMAQDIQGFKPAVGTWNYFSQDGAAVAPVGKFVPSVYASYGRNPLVLRNPDGSIRELIIEDMTTIDLMIAVGLHERLEVGASIPYSWTSGSFTAVPDDGSGIGDFRVMPKVLLVLPDPEYGGFGLALAAPVSLPTGDQSSSTSSRNFVANPKLIAEYRSTRFRVAANGGLRWRPSNLKGADEVLSVGNGFTYGAAAAFALGSEKLWGITEIFGTQFTDVAENQGGPSPMEALAGIRLYSDSLTFNMGGGVGVNPDFGAPEFRVLAGLSWTALGDKPGVALADTGDDDNDGIKNASDACPADPEDKDGFEDSDGCPELDNDQDGIVDTEDKCPMHAEDLDTFEDADGCPDLDNDQDGIVDTRDKCPSEPENKNGFEDSDGCPDLTDIVMSDGSIQILQKVYFDSGKATIKPQSFGILNQVALAIKGTPDIELLEIHGHTDQRGNTARNLKLSERRAAAVLTYLLGTGIAPNRLGSAGKGESEPVADGSTLAGAAQNRRVEFHIMRRAGQAVEQAPATIAPVPVSSAGGVGSVNGVQFSGSADSMNFTVTSTTPIDPSQIEAMLDSGDKVLIVRVGGIVATRQWIETPHKNIKRTLLHASKQRAPGAIVRIRMKKKIPDAVFGAVQFAVEGNTLKVRIPTSAAVAKAWKNGSAQAAPEQLAPTPAVPANEAVIDDEPYDAGSEPAPAAPTPVAPQEPAPQDDGAEIRSPFDDEASNADSTQFGGQL